MNKAGRDEDAEPGSGQGRFSVAAVIIARDEERCIARCIESVRPYVDEVLVVDTGSVDTTVAVAQGGGARVGYFAWRNDFAAARNAALDMSRADWHLIIDADEAVHNGGSGLLGLRERIPDHVCVAEVISSFDLDGTVGIEREEQMRILPGWVRYAGTVHNQPEHELPLHRIGLTLAHDGYEPQQLEGKIQRREHMLRLAVMKAPKNDYLLFQLARNLEIQGRLAEAADSYRQVDVDASARYAWHHILVVQMAYTLASTGRGADALDLLARFERTYDESSDYHFVLGNVLLDLAVLHPQRAAAFLARCTAAWARAEAIGEDVQFIGHVAGRGSRLAHHNREVVMRSCGS